MSHLWQRFLLILALVFGLALGVAATVFGYSNTSPVNVSWSVLHFEGIPLWTVAVVPLVVVLALGTLYHWLNNVHHFTENVRHRRRVHELEEEVRSVRAHLDRLLEMPEQGSSPKAPAPAPVPEPTLEAPSPTAIAVVEPSSSNGDDRSGKKSRKRAGSAVVADTQTVASSTNGDAEVEPRQETETSAED